MIDKIIYIRGEDDDASAIFDAEGNHLLNIDHYHGESVNEQLLHSLGIEVRLHWCSDFIEEEEYEHSGSTDEPANFQLLCKRIKERLGEIK